jgi:hypothetical protein
MITGPHDIKKIYEKKADYTISRYNFDTKVLVLRFADRGCEQRTGSGQPSPATSLGNSPSQKELVAKLNLSSTRRRHAI